VVHGSDRDAAVKAAIERRKAGVRFLTAEESLANMRSAICEVLSRELEKFILTDRKGRSTNAAERPLHGA
jgi:hypothetical protein